MAYDKKFMDRAIQLSRIALNNPLGGPFGCVIVKDGEIIGEGSNEVTQYNDPTAHAEVVAIRNACRHIDNFQLSGCEIYTSCEPCPMCLGAIYWARPEVVYYANSKQDAANIDFDDDFIYQEIGITPDQRKIPMLHRPEQDAIKVFKEWFNQPNRIKY
jgi:tRNA(Arg) A34 adenosine deaminase TadA